MSTLDVFLADVVMTGYYLAEPPRVCTKDLHDAEMKCLKIIGAFGPMRVQQIAELMYTTKARATQLTHCLENYGYITHTIGSDRRVKLISITADGQTVLNQVRQKYKKLALTIEQKLGKEKTQELCTLLSEITPLTALANKEVTHESTV